MNNSVEVQKLPSDLKKEISSSEMLRVEYKQSYAESKKIQATMISFSNALGGRIYVGVKEISNESGLHNGEIIGVTNPGITEALTKVRQWAESFRPRIDVTFDSYRENEKRVDVIEVNESKQKPVCSNSGLYKIRSSDGNRGIDPSQLREIIVGYESFKNALIVECKNNKNLLEKIYFHAKSEDPKANLNELNYTTLNVILSNGALSSFFNIPLLLENRGFCIQINKLLHLVLSAGGIIIPARTFYNMICQTCPKLTQNIDNLLNELQ